ncbi:MAG TPA: DUF3570 domain-containing protein, partial [Kofleriaceae bacterium]|nr:DUF3570 domain-containing protein [Kofleriaceae bacterium]
MATVLAALAGSAGAAAAQPVDEPGGQAGFATYVDQQDTVIYSPHAGAGARVPGDVRVDVGWKADVISSASVDVISAATSRMTETRHELGVRARRDDLAADLDVDAGYTYSFENDSDSHTVQAGAVRSLAADNWQVGLRYGLSFNRMGVNGEPHATWRRLLAHSADLTVTRLLGARTLAEVGLSLYYLDGYQASPYRQVPILAGPDLVGARWVDERVPEHRLRYALVGRGRRTLGARWVGAAEYRVYVD